MTESTNRAALSDRERELVKSVRDSGLINFDQLGKLVTKVSPELFDGNVAADDYIASAYSSVIKVWKTGFGPALESLTTLRSIGQDIRK